LLAKLHETHSGAEVVDLMARLRKLNTFLEDLLTIVSTVFVETIQGIESFALEKLTALKKEDELRQITGVLNTKV